MKNEHIVTPEMIEAGVIFLGCHGDSLRPYNWESYVRELYLAMHTAQGTLTGIAETTDSTRRAKARPRSAAPKEGNHGKEMRDDCMA